MIKIIEDYLQKKPTSIPIDTDFSDVSAQMDALKQAIFNTPLTDEFKIQLLKEELSSGTYAIESQTLADKLIEHAYSIDQYEVA